jgi:hypothetical protein
MQNKANFQKVKFNVNKVLTRNYGQMDTWSIRKTKPIQSQLKPIKSQLKPIKCQNKANSKPIKLADAPVAGQFTLPNIANSVSPLTYAAHFRIMTYEITGLKIIVTTKYGEYS